MNLEFHTTHRTQNIMSWFDPVEIPTVLESRSLETFNALPEFMRIPRLAIYITLPVALCFILLRIYARFHLRHGYGTDDCKQYYIYKPVVKHLLIPIRVLCSCRCRFWSSLYSNNTKPLVIVHTDHVR